MSSCDCSFVVVKAEVLASKARACLDQVGDRLHYRRTSLNEMVAAVLIRRKNRWYHFGRNKGYVPSQQEIDAERQRKYPWYNPLYGIEKYPEYNLDLRVKKEAAERLLAAAGMGEIVTVSTKDIQDISCEPCYATQKLINAYDPSGKGLL